MKWGTAFGSWGDVIVELGLYQERVGEGGIVYVGNSPGLSEFLQAQSFIHEVRLAPPEDSGYLARVWHDGYEQEIQAITDKTSLSPEDIIHNQLDYRIHNGFDVNIPIARGLSVPAECAEWAVEMLKHLPKPIYLVQPYSLRSNMLLEHWPHWTELMQWIFADKEKTFVVVGSGWDATPINGLSNVINLVGLTPTQSYVFAVADLCDGVITTSNSLAHYCVSQSIPSLVFLAKHSVSPSYVFRRVLNDASSTVVGNFATSVEGALQARDKFGIWPKVGIDKHRMLIDLTE